MDQTAKLRTSGGYPRLLGENNGYVTGEVWSFVWRHKSLTMVRNHNLVFNMVNKLFNIIILRRFCFVKTIQDDLKEIPSPNRSLTSLGGRADQTSQCQRSVVTGAGHTDHNEASDGFGWLTLEASSSTTRFLLGSKAQNMSRMIISYFWTCWKFLKKTNIFERNIELISYEGDLQWALESQIKSPDQKMYMLPCCHNYHMCIQYTYSNSYGIFMYDLQDESFAILPFLDASLLPQKSPAVARGSQT